MRPIKPANQRTNLAASDQSEARSLEWDQAKLWPVQAGQRTQVEAGGGAVLRMRIRGRGRAAADWAL